MIVIARSKFHLYINNNGFLIGVQLNHSEDTISNTFYSLPFYKNEDEVRNAFPHLH